MRRCGVGLGKRRGRIVLFFRGGEREKEEASMENGSRKQESKENGFVVCSPERMTVTHAHGDTVAGTAFEILFYECMLAFLFLYRETKPYFKETHPQ